MRCIFSYFALHLSDCGFKAHRKCSEKLPNDCMPKMKKLKRMFGLDLTTLLRATNKSIPFVVEKCVEEIECRGECEPRSIESGSLCEPQSIEWRGGCEPQSIEWRGGCGPQSVRCSGQRGPRSIECGGGYGRQSVISTRYLYVRCAQNVYSNIYVQ